MGRRDGLLAKLVEPFADDRQSLVRTGHDAYLRLGDGARHRHAGKKAATGTIRPRADHHHAIFVSPP
jgi:hypothetical protein